MQELTTWGEIVFINHTDDIVCECVGTRPPGTFGRGYCNLHGDSPIGGGRRARNRYDAAAQGTGDVKGRYAGEYSLANVANAFVMPMIFFSITRVSL